jgi:hypothetical protein
MIADYFPPKTGQRLAALKPRFSAALSGVAHCQQGRLWRRDLDNPVAWTGEDQYSVHLNPQGGAETTDSVVFPALSTEGPGTRMMLDTTQAAVRGGHTTGAQWDAANRGSVSVALGLDTVARQPHGSLVWSDPTSAAISLAENEAIASLAARLAAAGL